MRNSHGAFLLPGTNGLHSLLLAASVLSGAELVRPSFSSPFDCEALKSAIQEAAVRVIRDGKKCVIHLRLDDVVGPHCLEALNVFVCAKEDEVIFMTPTYKQTIVGAYLTAHSGAASADAFSKAMETVATNLHVVLELRSVADLRLLTMNFPKLVDCLTVELVSEIHPEKDTEYCLQSELMAGTAQIVSPEMVRSAYQTIQEQLGHDSSAERFFSFLDSIQLFHHRLASPDTHREIGSPFNLPREKHQHGSFCSRQSCSCGGTRRWTSSEISFCSSCASRGRTLIPKSGKSPTASASSVRSYLT